MAGHSTLWAAVDLNFADMASVTLSAAPAPSAIGSREPCEHQIHLPPPPPPSPSQGGIETTQFIDEQLLLYHLHCCENNYRYSEPSEGVYLVHQPSSPRLAPPPKSPLRQVALQRDVEPSLSSQMVNLLPNTKTREASRPKLTGKRRVTGSSAKSELQSPAATPPALTAYISPSPQNHGAAQPRNSSGNQRKTTPKKTSPHSSYRSVVNGRQISSPIMTTSSTSPKDFSSPRSVTPSRTQSSRSASLSTASGSSEVLATKEEMLLKSYFSDSDGEGGGSDEKRLSKKALLGGSQERRSGHRRFRRRLSDTFAFLSCSND